MDHKLIHQKNYQCLVPRMHYVTFDKDKRINIQKI